jgi:hypothetical protein
MVNRSFFRIYCFTTVRDANGLPAYRMIEKVFEKQEDALRAAGTLSHRTFHGWIEKRFVEQRVPGGDWILDWLKKVCPKEVVGRF